jgi:Mg2+/citrate symporter
LSVAILFFAALLDAGVWNPLNSYFITLP